MLFGIKVQTEDTADFFIISAQSEESATDYLNELGYADFVVCDPEELLDSQYGGLAMLATA